MKKLVESVYVGGPIDLANKNVIEERKYVHNALVEHGITIYNPGDAFKYGGIAESVIKKINDYALSVVDVVLLIFVEGVVTIGTPIEMQNAKNAGRLLLVVSPWDNTPCYITALADQIFKNPIDAVNFIVDVNKKGCSSK